jgi:hypothetical protein
MNPSTARSALWCMSIEGLTAGPSESDLKPDPIFSRRLLGEFCNVGLHYTNLPTSTVQSVKQLNYWLDGRVYQGSIPGKTKIILSPTLPNLAKRYRRLCPRR